MRLYSAPLSLFARKVEIALAEKGIAYERVSVPFSQSAGYSPRHPDVVAANPKHQVPVLIDGDLTLYDSTVILDYLEDAYPAPPLSPAGAADRARCRLLDLYADEVMLVPVRSLMHRTGPRPAEAGRWEALEREAAGAMPAIRDQHAVLDRKLQGRDCFFAALSAADIACFMVVLYSQRLGGPTLEEVPALLSWCERLKRRPAFAAVIDQIAAADRELSAPVADGRI